MKILFFVGLFLFPFLLCAQEANDEIDDFSKVKSVILAWADTTFYDYNEPRFENYRANYSDEYLIATMRVKSIERSIKNLKKTYSSGYYKESDETYKKSLEELEARKNEAVASSYNFMRKVDNYEITFWANIKLDSGIHNYIKHRIVLNHEFTIIHHEVTGRIGENENASILYR